MNMQKIFNKTIKLFWIFIIGSVIGYIVEMLVAFVQEGHFVSRQGLLYGPFVQVYGIGMIIYYIIVPKISGGNLKIFAYSALIGGTVEYICSLVQEKCFGTISWDYSNLWFNIMGRTSLLHCIYWGIAGVIFIKLIYPQIEKIDVLIEKNKFRMARYFIAIFMVYNITISCLAAQRQNERFKNIKADSSLDIYLDKNYPDNVMSKVYSNRIIKSKN